MNNTKGGKECVFIAHSSGDKDRAADIAAILSPEYQVFFDDASLEPSQRHHDAIRDAVGACDRFLFLASAASVGEGAYALTELGYAQQRWPDPSGRVLPVLLERRVQLPPYLRQLPRFRAKGNEPAEVLDALRKMTSTTSRPGRGRGWRRLAISVPLLIFALLLAATVSAPLLDRLTRDSSAESVDRLLSLTPSSFASVPTPVAVKMCRRARVEATVDHKKPGGAGWDVGTPPDISMALDGKWASHCQDAFVCRRELPVNSREVAVTLMDRDLRNHDYIGQAKMTIPGEARVGAAHVQLTCVAYE